VSKLSSGVQPGKIALLPSRPSAIGFSLFQENCGRCAVRPTGRSITLMARILFRKSISIFGNYALAAVDCRQHLNLPGSGLPSCGL